MYVWLRFRKSLDQPEWPHHVFHGRRLQIPARRRRGGGRRSPSPDLSTLHTTRVGTTKRRLRQWQPNPLLRRLARVSDGHSRHHGRPKILQSSPYRRPSRHHPQVRHHMDQSPRLLHHKPWRLRRLPTCLGVLHSPCVHPLP